MYALLAMESQNNEDWKDFEKYWRELESTMWKGLVFFILLAIVAALLWGIVHKGIIKTRKDGETRENSEGSIGIMA
mgnify:CR=1 FL=1